MSTKPKRSPPWGPPILGIGIVLALTWQPLQAATFQGTVYQDLNNNGLMEACEPVLPNTTLFIRDNAEADAGRGGLFNRITDENGQYLSISHNPGSHTLWSDIPTGWEQTAPERGQGTAFYDVNIANSSDTVTINFGLRDPSDPVRNCTICDTVTQIPTAQCQALIALYDNTDGDNWTNKASWKQTNTPCSWYGVTCGNGEITEIVLKDNNLSGTLPNLSALTSLEKLELHNLKSEETVTPNKLTGTIPNLSALTNLQTLNLARNQLSGTIPDLSALTQLQVLYLYENQLSGTLPVLSTLTQLRKVALYSNQLTGNVHELSALTNLTYLSFGNNQLSGPIPELSALTNLIEFNLYTNQLTGPIPELSALTQLVYLRFDNNQLIGAIPELSALTNLETLRLTGNKLCQDTNADYAEHPEVDEFPICGNPNITLTSPADGATDISISGQVFTWEPDPVASAHRIVISTQSDFADFTEEGGGSYCNNTETCLTAANTGMQDYTVTLNLPENTTFYWKVRASRNPTFWSEVHSFTTGAAPKTGCNGDIQLPDNLCEGLTAYYPMNGNANDASGNGSNGVVNGATLTTDRQGNPNSAYEFDGESHYISIADSSQVDFAQNQDFAVVFWVKVADIQPFTKSGDNDIIEKWDGEAKSQSYPYVFRYLNQNHKHHGKIVVARYDGDDNPGFGSTVKVNDDQFHHVAFVKNGDQLQLFIDGNLDATLTDRTVGNTTNDSPLFLGRRGSPLKNQFKGVIDDLLIYNRPLTASEIQTLYNAAPADETVLEDAEDGNTTGWRISSEKEGGAAFANVFDEERKSQVMEFTGSPLSAYNFVNPDGSPLSTTNFIARWNIKITDGDIANPYFNKVYWRVKTSGSVIYLSYGSHRTPLGCRLDSSAKYATCNLGSDLQDGAWHTITRDLEADLKAVAPDLEILEIDHLQVNMAGRIDDIQLLNRNDVNFHTISGTITDNGKGVSGKSLSNTGADCQASDNQGDFTCTVPENWYGSLTPKNTNEHYFPPLTRAYSEVSENITGQDFTVRLIDDGLEDAEDGETDGWSISANPKGDSAFANVFDSERNSRVMEFTGNSRSMYRFAFPDGSPLSTTNFIARWDMKVATGGWGFGTIFWRVETTGSVIYMEYRLNTPLGCHLSSKSTYAICGLGLAESLQKNAWHTITRDFKADLKAVGLEDIELQSVEYMLVHTAGRVDNIQLLNHDAVNFHTISGTITENGKGVSGKSLSNTGADCQPSDSQGHFSCTVPAGWYGSLTPKNSNEHYFAPLTRAYNEVSADITGQDFTVRLIDDVLEDAEDSETDGWTISASPSGDSAFANVVDSEKDSRVMEFTGNSRSMYQFAFPDGSPLSTTNFIARWDVNMATGFGTIFWRVETTGSVIYMEYRLNTPLGCHLSSKSTYAICGLGEMQDNTWYTFTRDFKADLKAVGLEDIELQSVKHMLVHTAGRVDNIQLLESLPDETVLENAEDGNTDDWSVYSKEDDWDAAFANVFDSERNSQVIEFTGNSLSGYQLSFDNSTNFIARWSMKTATRNGHTIFWGVKTSGSVIYLSYRSDTPLGCHFTDDSTYVTCGLDVSMRDKTWHTITRDLEADLKSIAPNLELQAVEHLKVRMAGRIDDIQLLNRNDVNFHTISGTITDNGKGVSGLSLSNSGADCQPSDNEGHFSCTVPEGWFGTLTPENTNEHYFAPLTRTYSDVSEDITGQDFTVRLIEDGVFEDAEDGDTHGWTIYDNRGDTAFTNVVESESNNRVIELTGHSSSGYLFAFPKPFSTTRFIAQWRMKMTTTEWQPVYWRVRTSGSIVYLQYGANHPEGCEQAGTYIICGLGENMPANKWYTITRDLKADLKAVKPDLELLEVEHLNIRMAGQIDDIQLLESLPSETVLEDGEDGDTANWSIFYEKEGGAAFTNVFDEDKKSQVIDFKGDTDSGYRFIKPDESPLSTENVIARWSMKITEGGIGNPHINKTFWKVKTTGPVFYLEYRSGLPLGCNNDNDEHYAVCGLGYELRNGTWYNITRDLEADLKASAPNLELLAVEHLQFNMVGRVDDIQLLNRDTLNFHTISGKITQNGQGVSGKSFFKTGADCQASDSQGDFTCTVPEGWYGSLIPNNTNEHYLAPLIRAYSEVSENLTGQNFTVRLIEDGLEDAEDGDTQGWSIYDKTKGDAALANVVESETGNRVIELTGHTSSGYQFAFPDGSPFTTNRFVVQWRMKKPNATDWQPVYWRVKTSGDIVYIEYHANGQKGCQLDGSGRYIICVVGAHMPANTWHTFTRDLEADLKAVKPDLELQAVEYLKIRMDGQIDDIKLLSEMPTGCDAVTEIPTAQCEALVALYDSTDGDNWTNNEGWKTTDTPCSWYAIECSDGNITKIDLSDNKLSGTIPELSSLTSLMDLRLYSNQLTGPIPQLSALTKLHILFLNNNQLTGPIPELSALTELQRLYLAINKLSGSIPELTALTKLQDLDFSYNQLTGFIPNLSQLANLQRFKVKNNQLSGEIPDFGSLAKLDTIDLSGDDNKLCRNPEIGYTSTEALAFPECGTQEPEPVIEEPTIEGNTVSLDASASIDYDPDGQITNYTWITSDGQVITGTDPTPSITFSEPGEHTVTLIITDNTGKVSKPVVQKVTIGTQETKTGDESGTSGGDLPPPSEEETGPFTLTLSKRGTGEGEFESTSPDSQLDCDIDCNRASSDYAKDSDVILLATPAAGSLFSGWSGGCRDSEGEGVGTVTMTKNRHCGATFELDPAQQTLHRVRVTKIGDGIGSITVKQDGNVVISCSSDRACEEKYYAPGTELTLRARAGDNADFVGWGEDCSGNETPLTLIIEEATKCTAEFALRPPLPTEYRLTVNIVTETTSEGKVTGGRGIECGEDCVENYLDGEMVRLFAIPEPHSHFKQWLGPDEEYCQGTRLSMPIIMDSDKSCTAIFGSDSDVAAQEMVEEFEDEGYLEGTNDKLTDVYRPIDNSDCLQEAFRLSENAMFKVEEHLLLTGSWPHQFHRKEWYWPLPGNLCTKSIQIISGGTDILLADGKEFVKGDYIKVEVELLNHEGVKEIVPVLVYYGNDKPESTSRTRYWRSRGYCCWRRRW